MLNGIGHSWIPSLFPPSADGVGWTVTVAGSGANQQGDLEMRLSFPADDGKAPADDKAEWSGCEGASKVRQGRPRRTQSTNLSAPPGRWSLTIRNQLPGKLCSAKLHRSNQRAKGGERKPSSRRVKPRNDGCVDAQPALHPSNLRRVKPF